MKSWRLRAKKGNLSSRPVSIFFALCGGIFFNSFLVMALFVVFYVSFFFFCIYFLFWPGLIG